MNAKKLFNKLSGTYKGRNILWVTAFGSHNYGLNNHESDFDYRIFLEPSPEDLYKGTQFSENISLDDDVDVNFHDVRSLPSLWRKSNISYMESLVTKDQYAPDSFESLLHESIFPIADDIASSNPFKLYSSLLGMIKKKLNQIKNDAPQNPNASGYNRRVKYGFDPKLLSEIVRLSKIKDILFPPSKKFDITNMPSPLDLIDLTNVPPSLKDANTLLPMLIDLKSNKDNLTKNTALLLIDQVLDTTIDTSSYFSNEDFNPSIFNQVDEILFTFLVDTHILPISKSPERRYYEK